MLKKLIFRMLLKSIVLEVIASGILKHGIGKALTRKLGPTRTHKQATERKEAVDAVVKVTTSIVGKW